MLKVAELKNMPIEKSADMVLKDLETRIVSARYITDGVNPNKHTVDIPWIYPKELTNVVMWELLESGYDVSFYHVDGGLNINIKYFCAD